LSCRHGVLVFSSCSVVLLTTTIVVVAAVVVVGVAHNTTIKSPRLQVEVRLQQKAPAQQNN